MESPDMSLPPTPDDAQHAAFFIRWWQEFLAMVIVGTLGLYFASKNKGKATKAVEELIVPIGEKEFENRMKICRQSILLEIQKNLNERDKALFKHIEDRDEKMLDHIRDIVKK